MPRIFARSLNHEPGATTRIEYGLIVGLTASLVLIAYAALL